MKDDHDDRIEVGVGSPAWFEKLRKQHVLAAAVGGFFGDLFGRFIGPRPTCALSAQGDLVIGCHGLTITIDRHHIRDVDNVIHSKERGFHLWTCDEVVDDES
jgi:hypothetical protein